MNFHRVVLLILTLFCFQVHAVPGTENDIQKLPKTLQAEALKILKQYQALQKKSADQRAISLDLEDKAMTSVYNKPGIFDSGDCKKDASIAKNSLKCAAVGWPDNKAKITPTGKLEFQVDENEEGEKLLRAYIEVDFSYEREGFKKGTGWVAQDYISFKPVTSAYSKIEPVKAEAAKALSKSKEICPPKQSKTPLLQEKTKQNNLQDLAEITKKIDDDVKETNDRRDQISILSEKLSGSIGQCVLKPPNQAPSSFKNSIVYDEFALPAIQRAAIPKGVLKDNGQPLSRKDMVDIDVLARTIYAEMAICTPIGAQYPMAVARVIRNREIAMQENSNYMEEFIKHNSSHDQNKSLLSRASTSPVLFTAWNQTLIDFDKLSAARRAEVKALVKKGSSRKDAQQKAYKKLRPSADTQAFYKLNESGLLHTLCPPSDPNRICYTGTVPDANSSIAWQNILKIAVEAVVFPEQFNQKTAELSGIKHYTSNRSQFYDFVQVKPSIEGRAISSSRCLNLWKEKEKKKKKR